MLVEDKSNLGEIRRSTGPDVISVGNLNIDLIGELERMPKSDEKSLLSDFTRRPGGGAANFAVASAEMGLRSELVARVGNGRFGRELMEKLDVFDVGRSGVKEVDSLTGLAFVFSTREREKFLIEHRGANSHLKATHVKEDLLEKARLAHGSSLKPEVASGLGKKAQKFGLITSLDLGAELSKLSEDRLLGILEHYDICFMNRGSFIGIFGEDPSDKSIEKSFPSCLEILAVTLGSDGALVSDGDSTVRGSKYDVKVRNTMGAGDVFAAGFDKCFMEDRSIEDSVNYASAAASTKVRNPGSWSGCPTDDDIRDFLESRDLL